MRRSAAALAIIVTAVALAGPPAAADPVPPVGSITCGTAGPPVCDLLDQLEAQLGPIQPVLALTGPVLGELGATVQGFAALAAAPGGVPAAAVLAQVRALSDQLALLPAPVRDALGAGSLGALDDTLDQIAVALAPVTAPVLAPTPGGGGGGGGTSSPTTTPPPASSPASATSSGGATGFGGSLSGDVTEAARSTSTGGIPDVPTGSSLSLAPLALPDFGFGPTTDRTTTPALIAGGNATDAGTEQVALAAQELMDDLGGDSGSTGVVVAGFSVLLLAAGLAAQAWQARQAARTIADD